MGNWHDCVSDDMHVVYHFTVVGSKVHTTLIYNRKEQHAFFYIRVAKLMEHPSYTKQYMYEYLNSFYGNCFRLRNRK